MKKHITAFYLETMLLIVLFVVMILVLTGVFGASRVQSMKARRLTQAVMWAENAAEAVAASNSVEMLQNLLDDTGNIQQNDKGLSIFDGEYRVDITWEPQRDMVLSRITVFWNEDELYELETAVYVQEAAK